ncbi:MAG: septum formation initiator family protein [Prevotella sp.]|jgi:cell division protein FtsB|nr:septum formation initiator family protein [Prevotella sp.]
MKLQKKTLKLLTRFKYIIVVVVGTLLITVIGENSMLQRFKYSRQIANLEDEIEKQDMKYVQDSLRLVELERNPEEIRKIARERYFMKASDEDIFVLSDEIEEDNEYETTK